MDGVDDDVVVLAGLSHGQGELSDDHDLEEFGEFVAVAEIGVCVDGFQDVRLVAFSEAGLEVLA